MIRMLLAITVMELLTLAGSTGLISGLLVWLRFRKKDDADTEKVKAEAQVSIGNLALEVAKQLREECKNAKIALEEAETELRTVRDMYEEQIRKLESRIRDCDEKGIALERRITELVIELERAQNNNQNHRPHRPSEPNNP